MSHLTINKQRRETKEDTPWKIPHDDSTNKPSAHTHAHRGGEINKFSALFDRGFEADEANDDGSAIVICLTNN